MPVRKIEKLYDKLLKTLIECQLDIRKFDMGNKTAGIRVRRVMQDVRRKAKNIRASVQSVKRVTERKHLTETEDDR